MRNKLRRYTRQNVQWITGYRVDHVTLVNRQTIVSTIVCLPANIASCKRYGKTLMKLQMRSGENFSLRILRIIFPNFYASLRIFLEFLYNFMTF